MPYLFGADTKTKILKSESHKLFQEFEVVAGTNLKKGQPVTLETAGTIDQAVTGTARHAVIGFAVQDALAGELVTVMMKAFAIVFMESATASLTAGPVKIHANGYNGTTGYTEVDDDTVTDANIIGWSLDEGNDGDVIRVALCQ